MPSLRPFLLLALGLTGCVPAVGNESDDAIAALAALGPDATVSEATRAVCTTASIEPLSLQIVEEMRCLYPNTLTPIGTTHSISLGEAVLPYLSKRAADALHRIDQGGVRMTVNSGLRTVAQQWMLSNWADQNRCKTSIAASPGRSLHETGQALDMSGSSTARAVLRDQGFRDDVRGDAPHFNMRTATDLRGAGVKAFQRLWNRNHANDLIEEDGIYGTETATRIARAPLNGFPIGACVEDPGPAPQQPEAPTPPQPEPTDPTPTDPTPTDPTPTDPTPTDPAPEPTPAPSPEPSTDPTPVPEVPDEPEETADPPETTQTPLGAPQPDDSTDTSSLRGGCSTIPGGFPADAAPIVAALCFLALRTRRRD